MLSLLVMFSMVTVTFMLVAGQYKRMSRIAGKVETVGNDPRKQLDEAFGQLARGTANPQSSLYKHDLLGDLYGHDGVKIVNGGVIPAQNPTLGAGGAPIPQLIDLEFNATPNTVVQRMPGLLPFAGTTDGAYVQLQTPGHYNGCVLTFLDGDLKGQSTRIVGWGFNTTSGKFVARIVAVNGMTPAAITSNQTTKLLINGRPFNGTGFGLNPTPNTNDPTLLNAAKKMSTGGTVTVPFALMPNPRFFESNSVDMPTPPIPYIDFAGPGGPDEDYDAADPQNMALAYVPLTDLNNQTIVPSQILPSFHRPDLLRFLSTDATYTSTWTSPTTGPRLIRKSMLRPFGSGVPGGVQPDHPGFTGSSSFNALNGPWDVDNDGDGVAESVWVDIGLPVQAGPDGRRYKPLVAYHCVDLDGRLNVNAHGNWAHSLPQYDTSNTGTALSTNANRINKYLFNPSGTDWMNVSLPRGMGVGPAEIDLSFLWGEDAARVGGYQKFLLGAPAPNQIAYEGRYGEWVSGGGQRYPGRADLYSGPGFAINGPDDLLALIRRYDMPHSSTAPFYKYYTYTGYTNYGSPCDMSGRSMVGVDYAGQPIWSFYNEGTSMSGTTDELGYADFDVPFDPYTLNLSRKRVRGAVDTVPTIDDNVFTPAELERVLRRYDLDASILPDRLSYLLDPTGANVNMMDYARLVTTDSFDLPTPAVGATRDMTDQVQIVLGLNQPSHLSMVDLLKIRFGQYGGVPRDSVSEQMIADLLPPEVIAGQKFDLNRPFGNGRDDDGNGVVDEPTPHSAATSVENETFWPTNPSLPAAFANVIPDYSNGADVDNDTPNPIYGEADDSRMARQLYARYLYVMMYMLTDMNYDGYTESLAPLERIELNARRIAQWAINVADYRDPDSIMTPFEYDLYPFDANGWEVDGVVGSTDDAQSHRRLVWGCEHPSLVLTETLALHDRRVRDTSQDSSGKNTYSDPDPAQRDKDADQWRVPEGSLFLELYCTDNGNASVRKARSQDIYKYDGSTDSWKLNLGQVAPSGGGYEYPVWRVAILPAATVNPSTYNINNRALSRPDTINFDPVAPSVGTLPGLRHGSVFDTASDGGAVTPERLIWFTPSVPNIQPSDLAISFYNANTHYNPSAPAPLLDPGRYAVVGPRPTTYVGVKTGVNQGSNQRFVLDPADLMGKGSFSYARANADPSNPVAIPAQQDVTSLPALPIMCAFHDTPPGWPFPIGLSVTEPLYQSGNIATYYNPAPTVVGPTGLTDQYAAPLDVPLDGSNVDPSPVLPQPPLMTDNLTYSTGTHPNYKTALLQRLANPLQAYDPVANPYITVDWLPIDLIVFNGEPIVGSEQDPADTTPISGLTQGVFTGRERGAAATQAGIWKNFPQVNATVNSVKATTADDVFDFNIHQSLGYLNRTMGTAWGTSLGSNYGYANAPTPSATSKPFSWITWNNRPYYNAMELLLVPHTSAEGLMRDFSVPGGAGINVYQGAKTSFTVPFKHLSNFFQTSDGSFNAAMPASPYLYRVLDYVDVPSPFVGTDTVFSPNQFGGGLPSQPITSQFLTALPRHEQVLASYLHPPFSRVSNYRDPGKVNINTIAGVGGTGGFATAWMAIVNGARDASGTNAQPSWLDIVLSRRGGQTGNVSDASSLSSAFANPFRTAAGGAFRLPGTISAVEPEINVTMLRPKPGTTEPLFGNVTPDPTRPYVDPNQHAYFRYQDLMRLSNSLTTRSNVYAVWITVGYFEVAPAPSSGASGVNYSIYPDGWQLGAELGSDTGDIQRHRAFYIFDRSIPVGYEPGKDHNLDDATLVKRYIE